MAKKNKEDKRILSDHKKQKGIDREEHFKNGGTLSQWRGLHQVHNKTKNSRSIKKRSAIRDSQE